MHVNIPWDRIAGRLQRTLNGIDLIEVLDLPFLPDNVRCDSKFAKTLCDNDMWFVRINYVAVPPGNSCTICTRKYFHFYLRYFPVSLTVILKYIIKYRKDQVLWDKLNIKRFSWKKKKWIYEKFLISICVLCKYL